MKFIINGLFLSQKTTGVHRFARETLAEFDHLVKKGDYSIAIPMKIKELPTFQNLEYIVVGKHQGYLWEQLDFARFLVKENAISINLCNSEPLFKPGIICIHDVAYKTHPEYFRTLHGRLSVIWHRLVYRRAAKSMYPIITVSYFSKYSLVDTYKIAPHRICVIGNGWQHVKRFNLDESVLERNNLQKGQFYFTLGNINYNKNTNWVIKYAKNHPSETFVLSGLKAKNSDINVDNVENVKWLGFLSDDEILALYKNCKAFIFPSIHEGFGIPPMEALSQGAQIIVANTTCLPEIYLGSAHYIDPYDTDVDLERLLKEDVDSGEEVLKRYGWDMSAYKLYTLLNNL